MWVDMVARGWEAMETIESARMMMSLYWSGTP